MLGTTLKDLRIKKGATQDDMAELLKIKRQTYSAYERDISLPDVTALLKMAEYFCVSIDELLSNKTKAARSEQPLSEKQDMILKLSEQLSDEDVKKLIDYAELLKKANTQ